MLSLKLYIKPVINKKSTFSTLICRIGLLFIPE